MGGKEINSLAGFIPSSQLGGGGGWASPNTSPSISQTLLQQAGVRPDWSFCRKLAGALQQAGIRQDFGVTLLILEAMKDSLSRKAEISSSG